MMNKKGQIETILLPFVAITLCVITILAMLTSRIDFGSKSEGISNLISESQFADKYISETTTFIVKEAMVSELKKFRSEIASYVKNELVAQKNWETLLESELNNFVNTGDINSVSVAALKSKIEGEYAKTSSLINSRISGQIAKISSERKEKYNFDSIGNYYQKLADENFELENDNGEYILTIKGIKMTISGDEGRINRNFDIEFRYKVYYSEKEGGQAVELVSAVSSSPEKTSAVVQRNSIEECAAYYGPRQNIAQSQYADIKEKDPICAGLMGIL